MTETAIVAAVGFLLLSAFAGCASAGGSFAVARKGKAAADIVVADGEPAPVKHAAAELADFLGHVTGAKLRVNSRPGKAKFHLLVGPKAAKFADPDFTTDGLGAEGIVLRTAGDKLILAGGRPRGTLYAVYTFLETHAGCRWWSSKVSTIPSRPDLAVARLDVRYVPPLEYRYAYWSDAFDLDWAARNKSNGPPGLRRAKYGGYMSHGQVHTFYKLIPPARHFKAHPEWFSLIKGRRTHKTAQLCLSNEQMRAQLVKNLKAWIRRERRQRVFSVSQNDWYGNCECAKCKAADDEAGTPAGSLLKFVNAVAEEIEKDFPNVSISTLAYQYTRRAPKNIRPRPNVIIQLCSIECSFSVPLTHRRNRAFRDDMIAWSKVADRLYIWDYTTNFRHYLMPHPNLRVLGPNVRFFVTHNARGIFEQGAYSSLGAEFAELRAWVLAKLLWDPTLDADKLIAEFCRGYYGPAAPSIMKYIETIHEAAARGREYAGCLPRYDHQFPYLSFDVLSTAWRQLKAAERAAGDDQALLKRVKMAQLPVMYAFIWRWKALRAQARKSAAKWPLDDDPPAVAAELKRIAKARGVTRVNEWHEGFGLLDEAAARARTSERKMPQKKHPYDVPTEDDPALPRVLLIGDSISWGYTLGVRKLLAGEANVHRVPTNAAHTAFGLKELDGWLGDKKWDLIHFNWGLHDIKHIKGGKLDLAGKVITPPEQYRRNLTKLVVTLEATGAKLIWAATTPVPKGAAGRVPGDAARYNAIALEIMRAHGVAVNDLHALVKPRLEEYQQPRNVHLAPAGSEAMARQVAQCILEALKAPAAGATGR